MPAMRAGNQAIAPRAPIKNKPRLKYETSEAVGNAPLKRKWRKYAPKIKAEGPMMSQSAAFLYFGILVGVDGIGSFR